MFGSEILDVAIGIIFVLVLVSIICSAIREGIEGFLKTRAAYLERGIRELLHDKRATGLARSFYEHPIIFSLYSHQYVPGKDSDKPAVFAKGRKLPSYIPANNFALALMDIAARGPNAAAASDAYAPLMSLATIRANIVNIGSEPVQRALLTAIDAAQGDIGRAQQNIQAWYDSAMDRVSGWYKRSTQSILFLIGIVVAVAANINTITIADYLYRDDTAREAIVARAQAASTDTAFLSRTYDQATAQLESLTLPIGWTKWRGAPPPATVQTLGDFQPYAVYALTSIPGWLLTALAVTLGAPFWFDLLNKMMVIRSTVKPREKSPEEGSEDRQRKPQQAPSGQRTAPVAPAASVAPTAAAAQTAAATIPGPLTRVIEDPCDLPIVSVTRDEDLPEAKGGVA